MSEQTVNVSMQINDVPEAEAQTEAPKTRQLTTEELEKVLNKEVTVNLRTIYNFKNIMEVMCARGALKANEMAAVGLLYNDVQKIISENL